MTVGTRAIGNQYLQALSVPLLDGKWCDDMPVTAPAAGTGGGPVLVNRQFVERFASGKSVVGRDLRFADFEGPGRPILGVVGDVAEDAPEVPASPYVYTCDAAGAWPDPSYVVRTSNPQSFNGALRDLTRRLDPGRAVFGLRSLAAIGSEQRQEPRLNAGVLTALAGAALLTASLGLYGLFMLLVGERTREIGVRVALGATRLQVVGLITAGAGKLMLSGILVGLAMTMAVQRVLKSVLFGVSPADPLTICGAVLILAAAGAAAIAVPAIRAGKVSPTTAMKE
jgi:hypothetical protein